MVYEFAQIGADDWSLLSLFSLGFAEPASPEGKPLFRKFLFSIYFTNEREPIS